MTKKKTLITCGVLSAVAVVGIVSSVLVLSNKTLNRTTADDNYWITFNSNTNVLTTSTTSESGSATAKTQRSSEIVFDYSNMSHANDSWQTIAKDGYFMNTTKVNGMNSLNITFANDGASIELQYGWNSLEPTSAVTLNAVNKQISYTFPLVEEKYPSLIKVTAVNSDQTITAMGIEFTCLASDVMTKTEFSEVYNFTETDDAITITGYKGTAADVVIPSHIFSGSMKPVSSIAYFAFSGCKSLKTITIPNTVSSLGSGTFSGCTALESVTIGSGITSLPSGVFNSCTALESVTIGSGISSIDQNTFSGCTALSSIVVDPNNTTYDSRDNCNAIIETATNTLVLGCKGSTIPSSVTTIGYQAFSGSGITTINIPNSVNTIYSAAFYGCKSLKTITIPSSVTTIQGGILKDCTSLTTVNLPNNMKAIPQGFVQGCKSLKTITIPDTVTTIAYEAFSGSGITTINIPNSVTKIDQNTFSGCTALESVTIGSGVKEIGNTVFVNCKSLKTITIPNTVSSLGSGTFSGCTALESVTIGSGITSLPSGVFNSCTALESVTIGSGISSIDQNTFSGCTALSSIVVDPNNTTYDSRDNCNAIIETATNTLVLGCKGSTIPSSVTTIGYEAFSGSGITTIAIPDTVTTMGWHTFSGCTALESVTIGSGITSLPGGNFNSCTALKTVIIGSGVTSIGPITFGGCSSLNTINFDGTKEQWNSVTKVPNWHNDVPATVVHCSDGDVEI